MLFVKTMPMGDIDQVQLALQFAIELEHATIPPYLTALYSLGTTGNLIIRSTLKQIAIQEMGHMATAANLLIAIGGFPEIDSPKFIPIYPGGLPFSIGNKPGDAFSIPLKRFSISLVKDVFLRVEEPENPITFPGRFLAHLETSYQTIGQFYAALSEALQPEWFSDTTDRQVTEFGAITDLNEAKRAIAQIAQQGEGTASEPTSGEPRGKLAHFYRFQEIVKGASLVADLTVPEGYSYSGSPIPFDATQVIPIIENPESGMYAAGSPARVASDEFNQLYTGMLRSLHRSFNGNPQEIGNARDIMQDMKAKALLLMNIPINEISRAAPTFEFMP